LNGSGQMFVFDLTGELKQIAVNRVTADVETFWGTPAVSDGRLVLRSSMHLYCVADKGETVKPEDLAVAKVEEDSAPAPPGEGGAGGNSRFDPMSMFTGIDIDKDGKLTEKELEGNRMADRLKTLDKDGDKVITQEEFRTGISTLFSRGGGGGGGGYRGQGEDTRPNRPQRPELAGS